MRAALSLLLRGSIDGGMRGEAENSRIDGESELRITGEQLATTKPPQDVERSVKVPREERDLYLEPNDVVLPNY